LLIYPFNCNVTSLLKWNKCEVCLSIIHQVKVPTSSQNAVLQQDMCRRFVNCSCLTGMHYIHLVYVLLLSGVEPASRKLFTYLWVIQIHRKLPAVAVLAFYIYIYIYIYTHTHTHTYTYTHTHTHTYIYIYICHTEYA
jgi:hypothetical protein